MLCGDVLLMEYVLVAHARQRITEVLKYDDDCELLRVMFPMSASVLFGHCWKESSSPLAQVALGKQIGPSCLKLVPKLIQVGPCRSVGRSVSQAIICSS